MSPAEPAKLRLSWLATAVFLPPAATATVVALRRPEDCPELLALSLIALWIVAFVGGRHSGMRRARWLLALCSVGLLLWPEIALRAVGFRFDTAGVVHFGWPRPEDLRELKRDPELFWTNSPDDPGMNSHGFETPEFTIPKPAGLRRLVFLGDSCVQQGFVVSRELNRIAVDGEHYEDVNLGVVGYSTYQGRLVAKRWLEKLEPDVVVILYGWNDHWQAFGENDNEKARSAFVSRPVGASRLLQWLVRLVAASRAEPKAIPRVSREDYRANLTAIGERAERSGAHVLFLTAPSSHGRLGVPEYLLDGGFGQTEPQVIDVHREYNAIVRDLAARRGWLLLDLEQELDAKDHPERMLGGDGIHYTMAGLQWVRDRIIETIARELPDLAPAGIAKTEDP